MANHHHHRGIYPSQAALVPLGVVVARRTLPGATRDLLRRPAATRNLAASPANAAATQEAPLLLTPPTRLPHPGTSPPPSTATAAGDTSPPRRPPATRRPSSGRPPPHLPCLRGDESPEHPNLNSTLTSATTTRLHRRCATAPPAPPSPSTLYV